LKASSTIAAKAPSPIAARTFLRVKACMRLF
jgi:hypothetical protein